MTLPDSIQHTLLKPDKHGNIPVSQVETDFLVVDLVKLRLNELRLHGKYKGTFNPLHHFFGYEGRCVPPSNFDAEYCYALGHTGANLIAAGLTGYTVYGQNMLASPGDWVMGGVPVTSMLNMELRKGKMKPVIKKALVELDGKAFRAFAAARDSWVEQDDYRFVGPIQYYGPPELTDARTLTLNYERGS
jgi:pyrophosphate--fructose-6-phosphate 1-phosphotransferase